MSRKSDLEQSIRESYSLIREYEDIIRLSDRPKEKLLAKREIEEQWGLVEEYLVEYLPLAGEEVPDDVWQVSQRAQSWKEDLERFSAPALFGSGEDRRAYRNRQAMIERVRHAWIEGVLEKSLYREARIELGLEEQPEAVPDPWALVVQEQDRTLRALPHGARLSEVFEDLGGALLLLGSPGSGKTTLLLELAADLLERAQRVPEYPVPVVLNLSSWAVECKPLVEWLVDELDVRYSVPRKVGQAWVEDEAILPLLDGLDEVVASQRDACAQAINAFRDEHGLLPLAVCCRAQEYATLNVRLDLVGAVTIQPLDREQVDSYLEGASLSMACVRDVLRADEGLYELLDSPLMLSVAALACTRGPVSSLYAAGTVEEHREHLFAAYVRAMHERRSVEQRYARAQVDHWLSWLAQQMEVHGQSVFLLERMQREWLPAQWQQQIVRWLPLIASGLILGLLVGLGFGIGLLQDYAYGWRAEPDLSQGLHSQLGSVLTYGLTCAVVGGLVYELLIWLFGHARRISPVETLHWSWHKARAELRFGWTGGFVLGIAHGLFGLRFGIKAGQHPELLVFYRERVTVLIGGMIGGLVVWLIRSWWVARFSRDKRIRWSPQSVLVYGLSFGIFGLLVNSIVSLLDPVLIDVWVPNLVGLLGTETSRIAGRLVYALVSALIGGPVGTLIIGLIGGLVQGEMVTRGRPNEGIWRSARNAWRTGAVSGTCYGIVTGALAGLDYGMRFGPKAGLVAGFSNWLFGVLIVGLGGGLLYGGIPCLQHLLLRVFLWRNDLVPLEYARFLDYATERIFLRKVGGGYIFVHRLLQDYFAGLWEREYGGAEPSVPT